MSIEVVVTFDDDDKEALRLEGELRFRFGASRVELIEDVTADDVVNLLDNSGLNARVEQIAQEHGMERNVAIEVMRGLVSGVIEVDPAPPHGIATVRSDGSLMPSKPIVAPAHLVRPKSTGNSPADLQAKRFVIENVLCPRCHALAGHNCGGKGQNYGLQHVHEDRIALVFGPKPT